VRSHARQERKALPRVSAASAAHSVANNAEFDPIYSLSSQLFRVTISRFPTVVHTAFQRVFSATSRCESMHLAQSPHFSTLAIHMNANNLRQLSLLRHE